jgi:FemAB-related protein (PEP-CTERM system-associated)
MTTSATEPIAAATSAVPTATAPTIVSTATDAGEWDAYVESHPEATADHLFGWQDVFQSVFGQSSAYLVAKRAGTVVGVLPIVLFRSRLFGRFAVSVPFLNYGGLLTDDDGAAAALIEEATVRAKAFGASHVELRHRERQRPDLPMRQHKIALSLPLPASADELWKTVDRKIRNQVRKAQKEGLEVRSGGGELVDAFYPVFAHNMRDLGTPVYSRRLFSETLRRFPDRARVFVVMHDGRPIAGSVTIRFRDTRLVPWASSLREFRHLCPNMLVYWAMLEDAIAGGAQTFDFGRSSPGGGTHHFKTQWGARETPLSWEYVLITRETPPNQGPSNPRFTRAVNAWKSLPLWLANRLGPPLARHLP